MNSVENFFPDGETNFIDHKLGKNFVLRRQNFPYDNTVLLVSTGKIAGQLKSPVQEYWTSRKGENKQGKDHE
jgi:hypothetical protein